MRLILMLLMVCVAACGAQAAEKKKAAPKPAAAKTVPAEVVIGQLTKQEGKDLYLLSSDSGEKITLQGAMAKRASMNLEEYVGKSVAITLRRSADKSKVTGILALVTAQEYRTRKAGR